MSRRAILIVLIALVFIAGGVVPWTIAPERLTKRVGRQLADAYGLRLTASGRTSIAFLPVPRIKFEKVAVTGDDGRELVRDVVLRGEVRILPLLAGRVELADLSVSGGRVLLAFDEVGRSNWETPLRRMEANVLSGSHDDLRLRRVSVSGSTLDVVDRAAGTSSEVQNLGLFIGWPQPERSLDLAVSFTWNGETVEGSASLPRPIALLRGKRDKIEARLSGRLVNLSMAGEIETDPGPSFAGSIIGTSPSLGRFARWLRLTDLGGLDQPVGLAGEAVASAAQIAWPQLRLDLGADRLDGAMAVGFGPKPSIAATLAADRLDLGWLTPAVRPLIQTWVSEPQGGASGTRLDLRLSASDLRVGSLRVADGAASLMTDGPKIDASLLRASFEGGTLKGRVTALADNGRADLKAQGSFEKLDLAALLLRLGRPAFLSGQTRGQISLEANDAPVANLAPHLQGRAVATLRGGEISGLDTAGGRTGSSGGEWPGSRVAVNEARIALTVTNGAARIAEAVAEGPALKASAQGSFTLADRRLDFRAIVERPGGAQPAPQPLVLDISGPVAAPSVTAQPSALG